MTDLLCVFCRRQPADPVWRPFCSERCKMLDLARWVDGTYKVASMPAEPGSVEPPQSAETETHGPTTENVTRKR